MSTNADAVFNSFKSKKDLSDAIKNSQTEGLYLEFKEKKDRSISALDEKDKLRFSEVLSQFANSDGGVLIWGVETKKKPADTAVKLKPISEVREFATFLENGLKDLVVPMVDGVEIKVIPFSKSSKSGFVKVLVPASDKTPHRANHNKSREYLKRTQGGKIALEHFDLEDMFGRRQKPLLGVLLEPKGKLSFKKLKEKFDTSGFSDPHVFELFVTNDGRAAGKRAQILLFFPDQKLIKPEFRLKNTPFEHLGEMYEYPTYQITPRDSIYYSGTKARIGEVVIRFHKNYLKTAKKLEIGWAIHAENMFRKTGTVKIKSS